MALQLNHDERVESPTNASQNTVGSKSSTHFT